ncbi:MAG: ADP-ribosylglycohydrolase family protein [Clostridia bacterium]|nr:ADP-ribosylglycohydrolase family protein [Clostridia bacterium]
MSHPLNRYSASKDIRQQMVTGSLVGDAYALGTHWIYDLDRVESLLKPASGLQEPQRDTFHVGKHLGAQTHYGDQALMLFQFLRANNGCYHGEGFRKFWVEQMKVYRGYQDTATRESITLLESGHPYGYASDELGGAARIAPILFWIEDPQLAILAAVDQARLTHQSAQSLLVTDLFTRTAVRLLAGEPGSIMDVLRSVRDERAKQIRQASQDDVLVQTQADIRFFDRSLENALSYLDRSPRETAMGLGQSCHAQHALPIILNILARNGDYRESLQFNSLVGGDSAARAMLLGLLLGPSPFLLSRFPLRWRHLLI